MSFDNKAYIARSEFNLKLREQLELGNTPGPEFSEILVGVINRTQEKMETDSLDIRIEHQGIEILHQLLYGTYWFIDTALGEITYNSTTKYDPPILCYYDMFKYLLRNWRSSYKFTFTGLSDETGMPPRYGE